MHFTVNILVVLLLLLVFIQDIRSREVYWVFFPALAILYVVDNLYRGTDFREIASNAGMNLAFLLVAFLLVWLYFAVRRRKFVYLPDQLIGWGDILFLTGLCFYFSPLNFILFYTLSLLLVVMIWLIYRSLFNAATEHIPLAGLQAVIMIVFLYTDWRITGIDLTNDDWLFNILILKR